MKATYDRMHNNLSAALGDLSILAGDIVGPRDATWQDVAGTCAVNLRVLAGMLDAAREGNVESFLTFPSPSEILESVK